MRQLLPTALAFALCTAPAAAQYARVPVQLGTSTSTKGLASSGDYTVAFWRYNVNDTLLRMSTSDGRGVEWADWTVLSDESGWADVMDVDMVDSRVYALWTTGQTSLDPDRVVHARSIDGGLTWSNPQPLPLLTSFDKIDRIVDVHVDPTPTGDRIYALVRDTPTRLTPFRSIDGGLTYSKGTPLTFKYEDGGMIRTEGDVVHVVYRQEDDATELIYRRSSNGGLSFDPPVALVSTPTDEKPAFVKVAVDGGSVVCATLNSTFGVRTYASSDGGATFGAPVSIPLGTLYYTAVDLVLRGSEVFLAHAENVGTFPDNSRPMLVSRSTDGGQTWAPPVVSVDDMGSSPELSLLEAGSNVVASVSSIFFPQSSTSASIWDPGTETFGPTFVAVDDNTQEAMVVANDLYGNVIYHYEGGDSRAWSGGFRPQTLTPQGLVSGSSGVSFDFAQLDPDSTVAWTLFALDKGDWILPDGRNLGLLQDALTVSSITLSLQGLTSAPLAIGSGTSPTLPVGIPPGLDFRAVGIGIDLVNGTVGAITDVIRIQT